MRLILDWNFKQYYDESFIFTSKVNSIDYQFVLKIVHMCILHLLEKHKYFRVYWDFV